jgi:hypothetical protein
VLLLAFGVPRPGRLELRPAALGLLPFGILVSAHLVVNQLRFGSWTEFGVRYQLGAPFQMSVRYMAANLWHYLFHVLEWYCQFPFLFAHWTNTLPPNHDLPSWLPAPDQYRAVEPIVGVLSAVPFSWLIAAPLLVAVVRRLGAASTHRAAARQQRDSRTRAVWLLLSVAAVTAAIPLLMLFAFSMRYEAEFMSPLLLLATLGGWSLLSLWGGRAAWLTRSLYAALAGLSMAIGVAYGFIGYFGLFGRANPGLYESFERQLDLCPRGPAHGRTPPG